MNKMDPRNYRNPIAGKTVSPGRGKNPATNVGSWFSKSKSKLGAEPGRHGLAYRSMEDGQNLIERQFADPSTRDKAIDDLIKAIG